MASPVKVLVCGDSNGNLDDLMSRVATVNAKAGPFSCLFCVGEFFHEEGEGVGDPLKPYKSGAKTAPIPSYFICGKEYGPKLDQGCARQEMAPNITFLGSHGIEEIHGLRVAFLSGAFPLHAAGQMELMAANAVVAAHSVQKPVDLLLTAQWPSGVTMFLQGGVPPTLSQDLNKVGSSAVAMVAKRLTPRYHFCGTEGAYYERPPYMNPPCGGSENGVRHVTRFIAFGRVGNPDKKNKWISAYNVTPVASLSLEQLQAPVQGATQSPYQPPPAPPPGAGGGGGGRGAPDGPMSKTICHVGGLPFKCTDDQMTFAFAQCGDIVRCHLAKDRDTGKLRGFGFVEFKDEAGAAKAVAATGITVGGRQVRVSYAPASRESQKRGRDGSGMTARKRFEAHPLMLRSADCWFCLSSPKVEKHLVVSIGDEVYLALAKGPLVPEHVLILPITHYGSASVMPDNVWEEVEKYMQALVKCFKEKLGKTVLIYERNTPSKAGQVHCHLQVVPVPEEKEDTIGEHVLECGRQSNIEFEPNPRWRDEEDLEHYVVYDVPSNKSTYLHKIPQGQRHPLMFAREVVANLLGMPERADWKNCALSVEEETDTANKFKELFKEYDWSLQ